MRWTFAEISIGGNCGRTLPPLLTYRKSTTRTGKVASGQINISGNKSSIWLYEESDSSVPHLHAIVSRMYEDRNINNAHVIQIRIQRATKMIARQRGRTTSRHIQDEDNVSKVSSACIEALRKLDKWSWATNKKGLLPKATTLYDKDTMKMKYYLIFSRQNMVKSLKVY